MAPASMAERPVHGGIHEPEVPVAEGKANGAGVVASRDVLDHLL